MIELAFSDEVQAARATRQPIVALESTIITHGMPHPQNVQVAAQVEDDIRATGAVPATIAVLEGRLQIGLSPAQLDGLGRASGVAKLSRADLAACLATGGNGGVPKGAEHSFDISADLQELAQTPVTVVAAGAKAILDIAKTLEVLETLGVPVIAFGQDDFPAFWSAKSEFAAPLRIDKPDTIARAHALRGALGLPGGQLVANPIPAEAEIPAETLAPIIAAAQSEADQRGITGKAVTPFLLQRIFEATEGRSLEANIALVRNNARLAARIAQALIKILR